MLIGSLLAPWQTHIRRLVAYLVLFQSGLILVALSRGVHRKDPSHGHTVARLRHARRHRSGVFVFAVLDSVALVGFSGAPSVTRANRPADR